jgi:predicted membrane chloride channel (bestrophin family)
MSIRRQGICMTVTKTRVQQEHTMSATTRSLARQIISRITATWAEMDHAQRRMLEIQTGITGLTRQHNRRTRGHDNELDTQL